MHTAPDNFKALLDLGTDGLKAHYESWSRHALTGRVESWINQPNGRLPVSCTVYVCTKENIKASFLFTSKALRLAAGVAIHLPSEFEVLNTLFDWRVYVGTNHADWADPDIQKAELIPPQPDELVIKVADSMEYAAKGMVSIEQSWIDFINLAVATNGKQTIVVDLSALRPKDTVGSHGLIASGPASFKLVYKALANYVNNTTLTSLAAVYSTLNQVLRRGGLFKSGAITLHYDYDNAHVMEFLNMSRADVPWAKRALNADLGILSQDQSTKILPTLARKMQAGDVWLVKKLEDAKGERIYLQVCLEIAIKHRSTCLLMHGNLGMCRIDQVARTMVEGVEILCNLHAHTGVGDSGIYTPPALDRQVGYGFLGLANLLAIENIKYKDLVQALKYVLGTTDIKSTNDKANDLAEQLFIGYVRASEVGRKYNMDRVFCVAPTATCSYRYVDREGYTTAPEITAPISREVERDSSTFGVTVHKYHPNTETAAEIGWDTHFDLNECFQQLMDMTGLGHSISMNWWSDLAYCDEEFIRKFMLSKLKAYYYSLQVVPNLQDKSSIYTPLGDIDFSILGLEHELPASTDVIEACFLQEPEANESFHCAACAE